MRLGSWRSSMIKTIPCWHRRHGRRYGNAGRGMPQHASTPGRCTCTSCSWGAGQASKSTIGMRTGSTTAAPIDAGAPAPTTWRMPASAVGPTRRPTKAWPSMRGLAGTRGSSMSRAANLTWALSWALRRRRCGSMARSRASIAPGSPKRHKVVRVSRLGSARGVTPDPDAWTFRRVWGLGPSGGHHRPSTHGGGDLVSRHSRGGRASGLLGSRHPLAPPEPVQECDPWPLHGNPNAEIRPYPADRSRPGRTHAPPTSAASAADVRDGSRPAGPAPPPRLMPTGSEPGSWKPPSRHWRRSRWPTPPHSSGRRCRDNRRLSRRWRAWPYSACCTSG
jgi:hypothetical protein